MALKHAILATLLDGEASGYELAKVFDVAVADFWRASPQQIYTELRRLEAEKVIKGRAVAQADRPNKRVFKITRAGRDELYAFTQRETNKSTVRDDLMVKLQAADFADIDSLIAQLDARAEQSRERAEMFEGLLALQRGDQNENVHLATSERIGPYLTCLRGLLFEQENAVSSEWAAEVLRARQAGKRPPKVPRGLLPRTSS